MTIPVQCPGCLAQHQAPDAFAGKRMRCTTCGTVISVPKPELEYLDDEPPGAPLSSQPPTAASPAPRTPAAEKRDPLAPLMPPPRRAAPASEATAPAAPGTNVAASAAVAPPSESMGLAPLDEKVATSPAAPPTLAAPVLSVPQPSELAPEFQLRQDGGEIAPAPRRPARPASPPPGPAPVAPQILSPRLDDLLNERPSSGPDDMPSPSAGKFGATCPQCRAPMNPDDTVCVECGFNVVTRRPAPGARRDKKPVRKRRSWGLSTANPYQSPDSSPSRTRKSVGWMPPALFLIFLIDLILTIISGYVGWSGVAMWMAQPAMIPVWQAKAMIAAHAAVGLFGVPANLFLLLRNRWAVGLAYFEVLGSFVHQAFRAYATYAGISAFLQLGRTPNSYQMGAMAGAVTAVVAKAAFTFLYVWALNHFEMWAERNLQK